MRFNVSYLVDAPIGAQGTIQLDERNIMLVDDLFVHHLAGDMQLTRIDKGLFAEGELSATIEAECVRCLVDFPLRLKFELEDLVFALPFVPKSVNPYRVMEDGWLNPLPALSEQIWLALPLQILCKQDCRGLCDQCGIELNTQTCQCEDESIDPRLAILKELL